MIPIVYQWNDGNGPVLSGSAGSLVNLLRKCLVDGYGDKEPAGWSLEFVNATATIASFRANPSAGTGFFLQVKEESVAVNATVNGYELMTSETAGTGPFSSADIAFTKSLTADTVSRKWALIATDTVFHLMVYHCSLITDQIIVLGSTSNKAALSILTFGDFKKVTDEGFNCFILIGKNYLNTGTYAGQVFGLMAPSTAYLYGAATDYIATPRPYNGTANTPTKLTHCWPKGPGNQVSLGSGYYYQGGPLYQSGGQLYLGDIYLADNATANLRGSIPGLYMVLNAWESFIYGFEIVTVDGRQFMMIPATGWQSTAYRQQFLFCVEIGVEWQ